MIFDALSDGGVAEWFKAAVLKTVVPLAGTEGSNPFPSANLPMQKISFTWGERFTASRVLPRTFHFRYKRQK